MPARAHPLPFAVTQPASGEAPTSEAAATEPDGARLDDEPHSALVQRILEFARRKRRDPSAAHDAIVVGKYALLDMIDEGAMGIVCTAVEPNFGTVALKFPKSSPGPQLRARVLLEGQLLARVHHTHVLRVYEVGECEDTVFIATEYVAGTTLRAWQTGRPWPDIVRAYLDAGRGLAAIHDRGIVHQDIKPDNIRVDTRGVVRVLDLGLAHLERGLHRPSQDLAPTVPDRPLAHATFYRGGTPGYMAPEQYRPGADIDARADQFAFCSALWEALHATVPFPDDRLGSTLGGPPHAPDARPRVLAPTGPRWLRTLLLRGLSDRREDRFPDMHALLAAIDARLRRRWWPALALAAAAATAGALLAVRLAAPALPMCEDHALGAWDDARDRALATAVAAARDPSAAPVVDSVRAELATHARRFADAHAAVCRQAHAAGSRALADERAPCFEQRRRAAAQVAAAVEQFTARHVDDPRAPWAEQRLRWLAALDPVDDCLAATPALALHAPALGASDFTALDAAMDAALTAALADDIPAARRDLLRVLALADDGTAAGAWHRARARLALVALDRHADAADDDLLRALGDAEASGDVLLAADILGLLVHVLGDRDAPSQALAHVPAALGKLTVLGLADGRRARDLHLSAAAAAVQAGQLVAADDHLARAAALRGDRPVEARERLIRAQLAAQRGDLPLAIQHARAAVDDQLRLAGPGTRPVADALRTLGSLQRDAADPDAETSLAEALRIYTDRLGPAAADTLTVHFVLAGHHYAHDRLHRARDHARAVARGLADLPPAWRPGADLLLGHLALQDDPGSAAAHYRRALAALERPDVPAPLARDRWLTRLGLARAELALAHEDAARDALAPVLAALDGDAAAYREHALQTAADLATARPSR